MTPDLALIFSLFSLGLFGGFTHCIGMCGPFVLTQVSNRLSEIPLKEFSNFKKLTGFALLPYHFGRISTYCLIGFFCSFLSNNIQDFIGFKIISALLLLIVAAIFLNIFFDNKFKLTFSLPKFPRAIQLRFKSKFLENVASFFSKKISGFFLRPNGLNGYLLGVILGFIPCGLLYAAFLTASTFRSPFFATIGMIFFGIGTLPSLLLTAFGGHVFFKTSGFKFIAKTLIFLNVITLILMATRLIN